MANVTNIRKNISATEADASKALGAFERNLKGLSSTEAIQASAKQLSRLREAQTLSFDNQLQFVYTVDQIGYQKIRASISKRLAIKATNRVKAAAIDSVVCPFYNYLFSEYLRLTDILLAQKFASLPKPEDRALFFCKAIHAGLNYIKWHHFDDQPAPPELWQAIKKLFKVCELLNITMLRVYMYPEHTWMTDASSLIASGAMFSMLHKENYSAMEIEVAAQYLFELGHFFHLSKQYDAVQFQYYLNLDQDGAAQRLRQTAPQGNCRYWTASIIVNQMGEAMQKIADKSLPENSPIRRLSSMRVLIQLFKKLQNEWSPTQYVRQRRANQRYKVDKYIKVDLGFEAILRSLGQGKDAENKPTEHKTSELDETMFDFNFHVLEQIFEKKEEITTRETWRVIDESNQGYGIDLGFSPSQEVDVGYILGFYHPSYIDEYVIAEVKSLKKKKNSAFRAGLESLSKLPMNVVLNKKSNSESLPFSEYDLIAVKADEKHSLEAIWLPADHGRKLPSSVILPLNEFKQNRSYKMRVRDHEKELVLGTVIAFQHDWVRASIASIG